MYNVFIEMPSGATSKPHEFQELADAEKLFETFASQMRPWKKFQAWVVMLEKGGKITTEEILNA
jgi:hypothetical protein